MASAAPKTSLTHSLALVWRTLRSMRTALILLLLLALASVAGSLLPQLPNSPERVASYLRDHGLWGTFLDRAGFFDVFGSWWFTLITVLLFVSLVACLIPRTRATWRALRSRPVQAREIDAFRHYAELTVPVEPDVAYEVARRTMRRRRFRVAADPGARALAGEKGAAREVGSLLFHWAFILLLVGVIWGKGTGFTGYALIVEGDTWIDAQANYDGQIREGAFFSGNFTGIGVKLNSFESRFRNTGQPMDFVSNVGLLAPDGTPIRTQDIRVNHPAQIDGLSIYQINWGWAPVIEVRDADRDPAHPAEGRDGAGASANRCPGRPGVRDAVARRGEGDVDRTPDGHRPRALSGQPGVLPAAHHRAARRDADRVRSRDPLHGVARPHPRPVSDHPRYDPDEEDGNRDRGRGARPLRWSPTPPPGSRWVSSCSPMRRRRSRP